MPRNTQNKSMDEDLRGVQSMVLISAVYFFILLILMIRINLATRSSCYSDIACHLHVTMFMISSYALFFQYYFSKLTSINSCSCKF